MSKPLISYRSDIDGLRAIAVMAVILNHLDIKWFASGYVGVDVFFVISGFLISSIIFKGINSGTFSFSGFYARRIRRIIPALLFVILVTLPFAWLLMTPDQLRYYGGGAFAAIFSFSNVWFYNRIDYFNPAASEDPLVHTWSLGVEEQFYLLFPLIAYYSLRIGPKFLRLLVLGLGLASIVLAMTLSSHRPQEAFYLLHTRAWELFAGVIAVFLLPNVEKLNSRICTFFALTGLILVLASIVAIPENAQWPGLYTFMPVCGTMLLMLFSNRDKLVNGLLSLPWVVGIGLISYSAYLWHQPIIGFSKLVGISDFNSLYAPVVIFVTLSLAYLTWRFVEQPFRLQLVQDKLQKILLISGASFISVFALIGHLNRGYPFRMSNEILNMLSWQKSYSKTYKNCIGGRKKSEWLDPKAACVHGVASDQPSVVIWGDSHAAVLAGPLGDAIGKKGLSLLELTISACAPITDVQNTGQKRADYCPTHNKRVFDYIKKTDSIKTVVIVANWNNYFQRKDYDNGIGTVVRDKVYSYKKGSPPNYADSARLRLIFNQIYADINALVGQGKSVLILGPKPEPGFDLPDQLSRALLIKNQIKPLAFIPYKVYSDYSKVSHELLRSAAADLPKVKYVDTDILFCDKLKCLLVDDKNNPLYFDGNHLSLLGIQKIIPTVAKAIYKTTSE
jgi:peptidoglycan/LPS O-acetylase OafA/YrhL